MKKSNASRTKVYLIAMGSFWLVFGLITTFYPKLMDLFQTDIGINAVTTYSNHVWRHDGLDILAMSAILFALSGETVSRNVLRATAVVGLLVTMAIFSSLLTTDYWNALFMVPGVCCLAFAIWGFVLASKIDTTAQGRP